MNDTLWLLVGKLVDGNEVKKLYLLSNKNERREIRYSSFEVFARDNKVVNAQSSGGRPIGVGISLNQLPTYIKDNNQGIIQKSGISEQEVIQLAQPYINKYIQDKQNKQAKELNRQSEEVSKHVEQVYNKLSKYNSILVEIEKTIKSSQSAIENEKITRYLKEIDIENSGDQSVQNLIRTKGVKGVALEIKERTKRLSKKATEYGIRQEKVNNYTLDSLFSQIINRCNNIAELHESNKKEIVANKKVEVLEQKGDIQIKTPSNNVQTHYLSENTKKLADEASRKRLESTVNELAIVPGAVMASSGNIAALLPVLPKALKGKVQEIQSTLTDVQAQKSLMKDIKGLSAKQKAEALAEYATYRVSGITTIVTELKDQPEQAKKDIKEAVLYIVDIADDTGSHEQHKQIVSEVVDSVLAGNT